MGLIARSTAQLLLKPLQRIQPGVPTRVLHPEVHFSFFPVCFPHPPGLSRQQKFPTGQGSDARRCAAVAPLSIGRLRHPLQDNKQEGMPRLPLQYFSSLIVINRSPISLPSPLLGSLVAASHEAPCLPAWRGPLLISNAAHGALCTCNSLNLTRLHFNYDCVRTESVA